MLTGPVTPIVRALLDEAVLRRPIGGPEVMAAQLSYLDKLVGRQRIRVHVLPLGAGAHALLESMCRLCGSRTSRRWPMWRVCIRARSTTFRPWTEYAIPHASGLTGWRTSSYSGSDEGSCVEVVDNFPTAIPVRDSKVPHGPALLLPTAAWSSFVSAV